MSEDAPYAAEGCYAIVSAQPSWDFHALADNEVSYTVLDGEDHKAYRKLSSVAREIAYLQEGSNFKLGEDMQVYKLVPLNEVERIQLAEELNQLGEDSDPDDK